MEVHHHLNPGHGVLPNLIEVKNLSTMALEQIPVSFEHNGKNLKATLPRLAVLEILECGI